MDPLARRLAAALALLGAAMPARAACPKEMADIGGAFCIDRYEAALVVVKNGKELAWSPYLVPSKDQTYRAKSYPGLISQGYTSGEAAAAACANAGKRLCTVTEWTKACRGPYDTNYPYGKERKAGACNDYRATHPVQDLYGSGPDVWTGKNMNDPRINQLPNTVARGGSFGACTNGYGVFDMVGNLHEWVDDPAGLSKGGFYVQADRNGPGCVYKTGAHPPSYHDYSLGFRCCRAVSP